VTDLTFRKADPGDVERLVEIHSLAFPDARGHEERRRNFLAKPFGPFADLHVAVEARGGRASIVGHAFGFGLTVHVGGAAVPMMGVATVGVAPEARGRGVASALLGHLHGVAAGAGMVAAFLYPFRQGFYARLGYVGAPPVHHLAVAVEALGALRDGGVDVRPSGGDDRHTLGDLYASEAKRSTGLLSRTERLWNMHFADERRSFFVVEREGQPTGYLSFSLEQREPHGETRLDVVDLVGETLADRRALLGFLHGLRDQVSEVDLCLACDDPLLTELVDRDIDRRRFGTGRVEHGLGTVGAGPMLHLLSFRGALEARGYLHDGDFALTVDGAALGLAVRGGRGHVVQEASGPRLSFTAKGLTAVAFGGVPLSRAVALGWAACERDVLPLAARTLELPAWHTWDRF